MEALDDCLADNNRDDKSMSGSTPRHFDGLDDH